MKLKYTKKELENLNILEIENPLQLLSYYPFRYERNIPKPFDTWNINDTVIFEGILIDKVRNIRYPKGMMSKLQIETEHQTIEVTIFNRKWIYQTRVGTKMLMIGKYIGLQKVIASQYHTSNFEEVYGLQPVYHLKEGISQKTFRKLVVKTLLYVDEYIKEEVPAYLLEKYQLIHKKDAIKNIHNPKSENTLSQAIRRLKYEEFLRFQLAIQMRKLVFIEEKLGKMKSFSMDDMNQFIIQLPFCLTEEQTKAVHEILNDLKSPMTMNRLLQGDVGSGKTIVGILAMYANYLAGYQSAFMVPTEILAKQHFESMKSLFEVASIKMAVLYSSMSSEDKNKVLLGLKSGDISLVVGTHSLIQETVEFHNLGLVLTDEQHRFGVKQRQKLAEKGQFVDYLMMSATPIPRTLASAYYGDMQISNILSKPFGRIPIQTSILTNSLMTVFPSIIERLRQNERCYIVCPSIEESESLQLRSVVSIYQAIKQEIETTYKGEFEIGLLHGKMKTEERDEIMADFKSGKYQILVSTTVIEVGVDVFEATMMAIYDADRFGLSQLHQLRGRIGRNNLQSFCYLLTNSKDELVLNRLSVLVNSNDGFEIAEMDLSLRGPGDILGTRQSGLPGFILGDLIHDHNILEIAQKDALEILENKDFLENRSILDSISDKIVTNSIE